MKSNQLYTLSSKGFRYPVFGQTIWAIDNNECNYIRGNIYKNY